MPIAEVIPDMGARFVIAVGLGALVPCLFVIYALIRVWVHDNWGR